MNYINNLSQDKLILFKAIFCISCYPQRIKSFKIWKKHKTKSPQNRRTAGAGRQLWSNLLLQWEALDQGALQLGFFTTSPGNHFLCFTPLTITKPKFYFKIEFPVTLFMFIACWPIAGCDNESGSIITEVSSAWTAERLPSSFC